MNFLFNAISRRGASGQIHTRDIETQAERAIRSLSRAFSLLSAIPQVRLYYA